MQPRPVVSCSTVRSGCMHLDGVCKYSHEFHSTALKGKAESSLKHTLLSPQMQAVRLPCCTCFFFLGTQLLNCNGMTSIPTSRRKQCVSGVLSNQSPVCMQVCILSGAGHLRPHRHSAEVPTVHGHVLLLCTAPGSDLADVPLHSGHSVCLHRHCIPHVTGHCCSLLLL